MSILIFLLALSGLAAVLFTLWGVVFGLSFRGKVHLSASSVPSPSAVPVATLHLEGHGDLPLEPGVLLNTLWEKLPQAECQSGECGGCKLRLLEGQVTWIREPVTQVDKSCEILACSCEPLPGSHLKCAMPT
jgi:hypothetical protein